MDLPINDNELNTIIKSMTLGGDSGLYQKLKLVQDLRNKGLPYKEIIEKKYGYRFD